MGDKNIIMCDRFRCKTSNTRHLSWHITSSQDYNMPSKVGITFKMCQITFGMLIELEAFGLWVNPCLCKLVPRAPFLHPSPMHIPSLEARNWTESLSSNTARSMANIASPGRKINMLKNHLSQAMYQLSVLHWTCLNLMSDGQNSLTEGTFFSSTKMQSAQSILCC